MPTARRSYPAEPRSVADARAFLRSVLLDWQVVDAVDNAALALNELTTNALLHARTEFAVDVAWDGDVLRVCVQDGSVRAPAQRRYSVEATTGRGLTLVEVVCRAWGVDETDDGKSVWFEIAPGEEAQADVEADAVLAAFDDLDEFDDLEASLEPDDEPRQAGIRSDRLLARAA